MLFIHIIRFFRGTVRFTVAGGFPERFLNLCARAGFPVFDTVRRAEGIAARTTARCYRAMRPLARKTGVRLRHTGKDGLPFLLRRYRKRAGILIGILLFAAFLGVMSQFVWIIRVQGNERVPTETILENLSACGVREGAYTRGIDTLNAERRMMLLTPDISWIAINLRASTATVEIKERVLPPERVDDNTPCNVVAARTGQIVEMQVYDGEPAVRVGDAVAEGDLLVSSYVGGIKNRTIGRMTHARAKVVAEFQEEVVIRVPLRGEVREPTGERVIRRGVSLFGVRVPLSLGGKPKQPANVFTDKTQPEILGLKLPLWIQTDTYELLEVRDVALSEDQAREEALDQLLDYEQDYAAIGEITAKTANGGVEDGVYLIRAQYTLRQDIAVEKKIEIEGMTAEEAS